MGGGILPAPLVLRHCKGGGAGDRRENHNDCMLVCPVHFNSIVQTMHIDRQEPVKYPQSAYHVTHRRSRDHTGRLHEQNGSQSIT